VFDRRFSPSRRSLSKGVSVKKSKISCWLVHQETGKGYVPLTKGYGGYTRHVAMSIVPIAPVAPHSLDGGVGSSPYLPVYPP